MLGVVAFDVDFDGGWSFSCRAVFVGASCECDGGGRDVCLGLSNLLFFFEQD